MKKILLILGMIASLSPITYAADIPPLITPQATTCIVSTFSSTGTQYWREISLNLKNNCGKAIDLQNANISFISNILLNTNVWGSFSPLSYPDNNLQLMSQSQGDNTYLASTNLHFPSYPGAVSTLPNGSSITLKYGAAAESNLGSANVYLGTPVETSTLSLTNLTAKPTNVSQAYVLVHLTANGQVVSNIQLPWNSTQNVTGLAPGVYTLSADNVSDSSGADYQGNANPKSVVLIADQIAKANIAYTLIPLTGKATIKLQALPSQLAGYTNKPVALLTLASSGSSTSQILNWNASTTVSQLVASGAYNLSTPNISYNGFLCKPTFNPSAIVANATVAPIATLTYGCTQTAVNDVTVKVQGGPSSLSSLNVTLTPNDGSSPIVQAVPLVTGSGSSVVKLANGVVFNVSSSAVSGYNISYNPQPLTSIAKAVETIQLSPAGTTPVAINGQLKVCGTQLCNQQGQPLQLRGMSTHGLQWFGLNVCLKQGSLDALVNSFKANVIRLSMYVQEGGYESNPTAFTNQVNQLINEANQRGIYVIVDWHILNPGDPNYNLTRAKTFFTAIATANKGKVNILYEIANEPNGVKWSVIKGYADQLIPVIRAIDPNSVILVGTPGWSSLGMSEDSTSQDIIQNPVTFGNIMYTFHFYAASHRTEYYNELDKASNTLPMFVTEWGMQDYSGEGANDFVMSDKYVELMARKKIGWTNWNYSDDFRTGAVWKSGTCSNNQWTDANLKEAGVYVKSKIIGTQINK
jgi:endoglucanase